MADNTLSITDFSQRLFLGGGRDQIPPNALRRSVGASSDPEALVKSRWGSPLRFAVPNVISMACFFDGHYLYDGHSLWFAHLADPAATVIDTGYNGQRMTMLKAPPAFGSADYLFMLGGGKSQKVAPAAAGGGLSSWGIAQPGLGMTAALAPQKQVILGSWNSTVEGWAGAYGATVTWQAAPSQFVYSGGGSIKMVPAAVAGTVTWSMFKDLTVAPYAPLDLSRYGDGTLSLPTDYISMWAYMGNPADFQWMWIQFNLDQLHNNYYRASINLPSPTSSTTTFPAGSRHAVNPNQWSQIAVAKSEFAFSGTNPSLDWSNVQSMSITGGLSSTASSPVLYLDNFVMFGGVPIGTGPAALSGGSTLKYLVTFGNSTTGNDSNPSDVPAVVQGDVEQAVVLNNIPVAADPQVTNRKLWRTTEGGATYFYLATIPDNTTTTYTDTICSLPGQPITLNSWSASSSVKPGLIVDGGNGYYFQCTNSASGLWQATHAYALNTVISPPTANLNQSFQVTVAGTSGGTEPQWYNVAVSSTVLDPNLGGVTWTNIGAQFTTGATTPQWVIPDTTWVANAAFTSVGEKMLPARPTNNNAFSVVTTGTSGKVEPQWSTVAVGSTITDGTVVWRNLGPLTTTDGTVTWTCIGLNASLTLGTTQVQYDNSIFPANCTTAVFFEGSMFVAGDPLNPNFVYISSPGKSEGYVNILRVGSEDDPIQKLVVWDLQLWVFTSRYVYPLGGVPPEMAAGERILGAEGTSWPFTVEPVPSGIIYRAVSGIRIFNNATNDLLAFPATAPVQRGQTVENVRPFYAVIAGMSKNEVLFSDGSVSFGLSLIDQTWRMIGLGFGAIMYHDEIQVVHAAIQSCVVDFESEGALLDNGNPIAIEWQTPSQLLDDTQQTMTKRFYIDCNLAGQILTPTLLVDNSEIPLPQITNASRTTIPIPYQVGGRLVGMRLTGSVSQRVFLHGIWGEMRTGR